MAVTGRQLTGSFGAASGRLTGLTVDGKAVPLAAEGGGFFAYDATAKKDISFSDGSATQSDGKTVFTCEKSGDLALVAEFAHKGPYVLVTGRLENRRADERGIILNYRLPMGGPDAVFCNQLNGSVKIGQSEYEGNVFPIAAVVAGGVGLAMAIPPSEPRIFGMAADPKGLITRFYLGLSPATSRFPNCASFVFVIYTVDPAWGFRSALSQYYAFFPEYYELPKRGHGLYLFPSEDRGESGHPVHHCGTSCVETQAEWLDEYLARDQANGIVSHAYMIVGQREIKYLPELPADYDAAMKAYAKWSLKDHAGHPPVKESEAAGGDVNLRIEVDSSTLVTRDGQYSITRRFTGWGDNSVTFRTNPNPDLFRDTHNQSVGRNALTLIATWLQRHPRLGGIAVDSLGANWPAALNYRKDHFGYARYPLTCDPDGRVALHNELSHYEWVDTLRAEMRAQGRTVLANGIYNYTARDNPAEHYRGRVQLGRFFLASLLDYAVSEPGIIANPLHCSFDFMRVAMGRKVYAPTNARWEDGPAVERWVNRCLCYGMFGTNVRTYSHEKGKIKYYYPAVYQRDQRLFDWFVPKVRLLSRAGWEPVTYARASGEKVLVERYGSGDKAYLAVMTESDSPQDCVLTVDLESLGFNPSDHPHRLRIDEMAQGTPLGLTTPGQVALRLEPHKTCIIAIQKA